MNSELLATCNALGYLEEENYFKEDDCLDNIKCLIKYLHNEDSTRDIRVQLGSAHVVQNDLISILCQYVSDSDLFHAVLRLVINLTQPALLCFGGKIPKDTVMHHHYLEVLQHNQAYKEAFGSHEKVWKVLTQKVYDILETDWEDRRPDEGLVIERFLVLLRNLLHVPPTTEDTERTSEDMSSHDKLLWQLHAAGVESLLLYMSGSNTEQEFSLHLMEIICLFLKEQEAETLAKAGTVPNAAEREKEGNKLLELRRAEDAKRKQNRAKMTPWHSRFGGTYVCMGTKALADEKDVILHKSVKHCEKMSFDEGKAKVKKARNRRALVDDSIKRRSSGNIRIMLKSFCNGLLENSYNMFMRAVKDRITREKAQDQDETYYFWTMSFFLEFNRHNNFRIELVSETMQLSTLHFLDTQMVNYIELMTVDKHEAAAWGKRMHLALRCYYEFLMTVYVMETSNDSSLNKSARVLMNNIFYVVEYREIFLTLLRKFDERKQTRAFLKDVAKATHLFLKMFENFCKDKKVVVETKVRGPGKKRRKKKTAAAQERKTFTEEEKAAKWGEIQNSVTEAVKVSKDIESSNSAIPSVFDPTSDISEEMQQQQTLLRTQCHLLDGETEQAVQVLRTARSVWPEKGIFGTETTTEDEEITLLHEICLADLSHIEAPVENLPDEEDENEIDEEEESAPRRTKEIEFNFQEFVKKFADARVVIPYVKLLQDFEKNDAHVNHCVVKIFHRIGFDLKTYGLLFQASLFRVFQKVFAAAATDSKSYRELVAFAKWLMGKFSEVSQKNSCVYAELLFWNSVAEAHEITDGYGTYAGSKKQHRIQWTQEETNELTELYHQYKEQEIDTVDGILTKITDQTRTRRQVCNQLVNIGLVESLADLKRTKGSRAPVTWKDDDVEELKRLYEEFSSSEDPVGNIIQMLSNKKSKAKVIDKILSLGLATDRKQLYKKKARKSKGNRPQAEIMHIGGSDSDDNNDQDADESSANETDSSGDESAAAGPAISIEALARDCFEAGLEAQVTWLRECVESSSNNDEQTDGDLVPLVPLTDEQESAMSNRSFKKLLKAVGIKAPANEQERFWRIPTSVGATQLDSAVESLAPPKKRKRMNETLDSDGDESEPEKPQDKRRKAMIIDDDDDED
uniref:Protein timeless homolog n=1 Tax=Phallusia mammillata TaxID=59560 RepID=A0A6F9DV98_9ASCI|nr:protein timeless homolog [Phallusia mammillata]